MYDIKRAVVFLFSIFLINNASSQVISASIQKVKMDFMLDAKGKPIYSVFFDQKPIIQPSELGFTFLPTMMLSIVILKLLVPKKNLLMKHGNLFGEK